MLVDQRRQRIAVAGVGLGQGVGVLGGAGMGDHRLQVGRQRSPGRRADDALGGAVRLVEGRPIVQLGDLVEARRKVAGRPQELDAVDRAALQGRVDVRHAQRHGHRTQPLEQLAAQAGAAQLEPLEIGQPVDLVPEPAAHLQAGVAGHERLEPERRVELVPQRLPAAVLDPGLMLGRGQAERHRGEERRRLDLAGPVERGAVAHLGGAGIDRVEHLQRRHQLAGGEQLHGEPAAAELADPVGQALGVHARPRQVAWPRGDHPPAQSVLGAQHGGRRERAGAADQQAAAGAGGHGVVSS